MSRLAVRLATLLFALGLPAAAHCGAAESPEATASHRMRVRIEPQTQQLSGQDLISFAAPRAVTLLLSSRFRIASLSADNSRVELAPKLIDGLQHITLHKVRRIEIAWSGKLAPLDRSLEHRDTLAYHEAASGSDGTFLPSGSGWYPAVDGALERYRIEIDLPAGQHGLVPGRLLDERESNGRSIARFDFSHPAEGIALMAGPYRIEERRVRSAAGSELRLRTYFHPEIADLAAGYLDSIKGYIDLYERWIGPYPYSEFSVVSSPTPTGFGLPTLTYLGVDVLRLPFIRATSLGHEILHNWWGNGVYPDYARGNWSEGLTTFMADYAYRERDSADAARAARLAWLRDFAAMPPDDDRPLARFTSRSHGASQIVGYDKSAMLFFMLRDLIGKDAFDAGLRGFWRSYRFRIASWDDLRGAFERASARDLGVFFAQWLQRSGAPALRIAGAKAEPAGKGWRLSVTLDQGAPAYALPVPLVLRTAAGEVERRVELEREHADVVLELLAEPLQIALDPDLRLWRHLAPGEAPPILRDAMLAARPALILASADAAVQAAAQALAGRLLERAGAAPANPDALMVAGLHADIDAWLAREKLAPRPDNLAPDRGSAKVWTARSGDGRVVLLVSARDAASLAALARPLPHYGRESWLVFDGARMLARGSWPSRPQVWQLGKNQILH